MLNCEPAASSSSLPGGHQQGITRFAARCPAKKINSPLGPRQHLAGEDSAAWQTAMGQTAAQQTLLILCGTSAYEGESEVYIEALQCSTTRKATGLVLRDSTINHSWDDFSV